MFKIGDYVVSDYGKVTKIVSETMLAIANFKPEKLRHATQEEIEKYHLEEFE